MIKWRCYKCIVNQFVGPAPASYHVLRDKTRNTYIVHHNCSCIVRKSLTMEVFRNEVCHSFSVAQAHLIIVYWDCTCVFLQKWGMVEWIICHKVINFVSACNIVKIDNIHIYVCTTLKLGRTSLGKVRLYLLLQFSMGSFNSSLYLLLRKRNFLLFTKLIKLLV